MAESHREEIAKLESLYAGNPGGRVFVHLAEAYRKAGEHERARRILEEGLARHADSASGFVVLGRVLADMQITAEAETAFQRVLELDGGNLVALRWLGDLARQSGRNAAAAAYYRELLVRNPSNEEVRELVEIVERESTGAAAAPSATPQTAEPEPGFTIETDDTAVAEPVSEAEEAAVEASAQAGTLDEEDVSPWSAAPGRTDDTEESPVEYGLVDIGAPGAPPTGEPEPAVEHEAPDLVTRIDEQEGDLELQELPREDEAEPVEIHLLDPAWEESGEEAEPGDEPAGEIDLTDLATLEEEQEPIDQLEDVTLDLAELAPEEEPDGDYADDEFLADLISASAGEEAPDVLEGEPVDVLDEASPLTLLGDEDTPRPEEPAPGLSETTLSDLAGTAEPAAEEDLEPDVVDRGWIEAESGIVAPDTEAEPGEDVVTEPEAPVAPELPTFEVEPEEYTVEAAQDSVLEPTPSASAAPAPSAEAESERKPAAPAERRPPISSEAGLMTETMALLYRSQGFHDRAAEVYRALLRSRPDDERLRDRLREVEAAGRAAAAPAPPPAAIEDESGEVWLRGVGAPWTAGATEAPVDATPYAWTEAEEVEQGEAIGAYLQDLVSWKPGGSRWSEAAAEPQPRPGAAPLPAWMQAPESPETGPETAEPWADAAMEELASWAPEGEPDGDISVDDIPADPWLQAPAVGGGEIEEESGEGWTPLELEADAIIRPGAVPANTPPPVPPQSEEDEDAEDEDLEMFRSWLQSLKK